MPDQRDPPSSEEASPNVRELFEANLDLIRSVVACAARRHRLDRNEAEEFASVVNLKLIDDDYRVLRQFRERSSLARFIAVVAENALLDERTHRWGKWHASAEATRLGPLAVELERLLFRDGRTLAEVEPMIASRYEGVSRAQLVSIIDRLPQRPPRRRSVDVTEADSVAAPSDDLPSGVFDGERRLTSDKVSEVICEMLRELPEEDSNILYLHFECSLSLAQIARSLQLDSKPLYRRRQRLLAEMRRRIERVGVRSADVADLIGRDGISLQFDLRNHQRGPSRPIDEGVQEEISQ